MIAKQKKAKRADIYYSHTRTHRCCSCPGNYSPGPGKTGRRSKLATEVGQVDELHQGHPSVLPGAVQRGAAGHAASSRARRSGDGGDGRCGADRAWGGAGFDATVEVDVDVGVGVGVGVDVDVGVGVWLVFMHVRMYACVYSLRCACCAWAFVCLCVSYEEEDTCVS